MELPACNNIALRRRCLDLGGSLWLLFGSPLAWDSGNTSQRCLDGSTVGRGPSVAVHV